MTTDPTPDLCCVHGQQLIERAERILDLLEARHAKREPEDGVYRVTIPESSLAFERAKRREIEAQADDYQGFPSITEALAKATRGISLDPEVPPKLARGGIVNVPEGSETVTITYDPDRDGPLITAEQARAMFGPVLDELNEGRRPEQGHIVNSPRFQAALEDFRQKYEQGRLDEL